MSPACIYGTECTGPGCEDCARYVEPETQDDKDAEIDRAYGRMISEGKVLREDGF